METVMSWQGGGWVFLSVLSAVFTAMFFLINQFFKLPGRDIVVMSRVMVVAVMTPFMAFVIEWPTDPVFYAVVFASAILGVIGDTTIFNASAKYGAGAVGRVQPVNLIFAFFLWFLFYPSALYAYADMPVRATFIFLSICGCVFFASRMRQSAINADALRAVAPALVCYAFTVVCNKMAMNHAPLHGGVYGYMYVQSIFAIFLVGGHTVWQAKRNIVKPPRYRDRKLLHASFLMTIAYIFHMIFKMYAVGFSVNPSYVAAIGMTAPIFIALYYRLIAHKEEGDVKNGMGIVLCAMALAALTVR